MSTSSLHITRLSMDAPDYIAVMCATIRVIRSVISNYIQLFTVLIGLTNALSVHILQKQRCLRNHMTIHKKDREILKCPKCNYKAFTKYLVNRHIKAHHEDKNKEHATDGSNIHDRKSTHEHVASYNCTVCAFKGNSKAGLTIHMKRMHKVPPVSDDGVSQKAHSCKQCSFSATTSRGLSMHISHIHVNKHFTLTCEHCDFTTKKPNMLEKHMVQKYCCPHCDYVGQTWVLKHHVSTHGAAKERSLKCTYCDYKTSYSLALKVHICTHTGEKSPLCPQ